MMPAAAAGFAWKRSPSAAGARSSFCLDAIARVRVVRRLAALRLIVQGASLARQPFLILGGSERDSVEERTRARRVRADRGPDIPGNIWRRSMDARGRRPSR